MPITVFKRKYDGGLKREFTGDLVEETADGWLVVVFDRSRHVHLKDGVPQHPERYIVYHFQTRLPVQICFYFDGDGNPDGAQCDAALPTTRDGDTLTYVDLDLDLMVDPDGSSYERDYDAFEKNREPMGYTPEIEATAHESLCLAAGLLDANAFPFDGSPARTLARERARHRGSGLDL